MILPGVQDAKYDHAIIDDLIEDLVGKSPEQQATKLAIIPPPLLRIVANSCIAIVTSARNCRPKPSCLRSYHSHARAKSRSAAGRTNTGRVTAAGAIELQLRTKGRPRPDWRRRRLERRSTPPSPVPSARLFPPDARVEQGSPRDPARTISAIQRGFPLCSWCQGRNFLPRFKRPGQRELLFRSVHCLRETFPVDISFPATRQAATALKAHGSCNPVPNRGHGSCDR